MNAAPIREWLPVIRNLASWPQEWVRFFSEVVRRITGLESQLNAITFTGASVTLTLADSGLLLFDTTSNNIAAVLPDATTAEAYPFTIKRTSAGINTLTITAAAGTIDGGASASIPTQYTALTFRSDGANWWIV